MSTYNDNDRHCSLSVRPQRIDKVFTGILENFKQTETEYILYIDRIDPALKEIYQNSVKCWSEKICTDLYSKENAKADAEEAVNEVISRATHEMQERIDNIVHDAAKYKIPRILSNMSASRSYDNTCAQNLMCDVMEQVRNLNLEGLVNEAARLSLANIETYSNIENNYARTGIEMFNMAKNMYEKQDHDTDVRHSLNGDAVPEILAVLLGGAVFSLIIEKLYQPSFEHQADVYKEIMANCGA